MTMRIKKRTMTLSSQRMPHTVVQSQNQDDLTPYKRIFIPIPTGCLAFSHTT